MDSAPHHHPHTASETERQVTRVLVIDDQPMVCQFLRELLERHGYICEFAHEGQEGFRRATREFFDLLILDIVMPNWQGLETLDALAIAQPDCRVVVQSGYLNPELMAQLRTRQNVIAVFQKPFNVSALLDTVRRIARP